MTAMMDMMRNDGDNIVSLSFSFIQPMTVGMARTFLFDEKFIRSANT